MYLFALLADIDPPGPPVDRGGNIRNPLLSDEVQSLSGIEYIQRMVPNLVGIAFIVGALTFFAMFIFGAIAWIGSGGDKANLESARGRIMNALIGLVVLFATFAIIKLIEEFFGVNILELDLGPLTIT